MEVVDRTAVRLTGQLAAYDGSPVPLPLYGQGEEWDVLFVSPVDDRSTAICLWRRGSMPVTAVAAGSMAVDSGTIAVTTVEQLRSGGRLGFADSSPWIVPGAVSDSIRVDTGFGDGVVSILALVDADGQMCGVVLGDVFEDRAWEERLLPGEPIVSSKAFVEGIRDEGTELAPVAVHDKEGTLLGYVTDWDFSDAMNVYVSASPRTVEPTQS